MNQHVLRLLTTDAYLHMLMSVNAPDDVSSLLGPGVFFNTDIGTRYCCRYRQTRKSRPKRTIYPSVHPCTATSPTSKTRYTLPFLLQSASAFLSFRGRANSSDVRAQIPCHLPTSFRLFSLAHWWWNRRMEVDLEIRFGLQGGDENQIQVWK